MSDTIKHDVKQPEKRSVETVAEFDALLEVLKVQSPVSYAIQMENGEFERFRKTLKDYQPPKEEAKVEEEPEKEKRGPGRPKAS